MHFKPLIFNKLY